MIKSLIKDSDFITSPEVPGPTKEEIRCLVMCKSHPRKGDIVVDVGCGSGGLTLGFAQRVNKVYAIDQNPQAVDITRKNLIKHDLHHKVELIENDALSSIKDLENFDIMMIGGSGGDIKQIIELGSKKLNKNGRIIITAILLETKVESIQKLKELGFDVEIVDINISRGKIIDRGTMMYAQNPISVIYTI